MKDDGQGKDAILNLVMDSALIFLGDGSDAGQADAGMAAALGGTPCSRRGIWFTPVGQADDEKTAVLDRNAQVQKGVADIQIGLHSVFQSIA